MSTRANDRNRMEHHIAPATHIPWGISPDLAIEYPARPVSPSSEGSSPPDARLRSTSVPIMEDLAMKTMNDRATPVLLRFARIPIPPDGPVSVDCMECDSSVEIHQPDSELPDRMLGTCEQCQTWYLLECDPDAGQAALILLPDSSLLRGLLENQS
jgi:hypothetical protein